MIGKVLARLLTGFLLAGALAACAPPAQAPNPALWRISDEDSTIWLFGTVHMLPEGVDWRTARIDQAFAAAEELIVETDTSAAAQQSIAALAQQHGALPIGQRLSQQIDGESQARMARICSRLGIDPTALEGLRPWLAALHLSVAFAQSQGHSAEHGVETALLRDAAAQGKRLSFLESGETQVRALADLAPAEQAAFLKATLQEIEGDENSLAELDAAWLRGDVEALSAMMEDELRDVSPAAYAALITRRNEAWVEEIARLLEGEGDIFIAVGAAHLAGDDSVIALLRARGVTIEGP